MHWFKTNDQFGKQSAWNQYLCGE